jgi:hypothetical protein
MAYGGDAQAEKVRFGMRGVALEIAMQRVGSQRGGQGIAGPGEMIHADLDVARTCQGINDADQEAKLLFFGGKIPVQSLLLTLHCRHMGITEGGDPVGR